jgi:hypothetical protein
MFNDQEQLGFRRNAIFGALETDQANASGSFNRANKMRRLGNHATQPAKTRY